jgi:hypothetical protein
MPDRILQIWFKAVASAFSNPPHPVTPHTLNNDAKKFIKNSHTLHKLKDKKIVDEADHKGYEVIGGETASLKCFYLLAQEDLFCSTTRAPIAFDKSNPSNEPFTVSFNRKIGSVGPSRLGCCGLDFHPRLDLA